MSRVAAGRARGSGGASSQVALRELNQYYQHSQSPLTVLIFLLPALIFYEVGTRLFASDLVTRTETRVLAFTLMRQFLGLFGATGHYLPGLALPGILIAWHIARRDPWQPHVGTAMLMVVESALMAIPLLAIGKLVGSIPLYAAVGGWKAGVVLALGAGIYEELVFRLAAFTLLNILLIDLMKVTPRSGYILILVGSAVLFAYYHHWSPQAAPFRLGEFLFRTASGLYFGVLFMTRGFGVTAGSHIAYDIYYFVLRSGEPI